VKPNLLRASSILPSLIPFSSLSGLAGLVLLLHPFLTGCGNGRPVPAESSDTRVTFGEGTKHYPRFSPDGKTLTYSTKEGPGQTGGWAVFTVSTAGGEPQRVSPDSVSQYAIDWTPDGKAIYVYNDADLGLCRLGLDGRIEEHCGRIENGHIEDVSADGERFLVFRFTGRSYDAGTLECGSQAGFQAIAQTPEWELYGSFGPGPGEVTVCRFGTYGDPVSQVLIWSPQTREFSPLPLPKGRHLTPSWSPDGRYLAWSSNASGNVDLWIYERETGRTIQATKTFEDENAPHWSPDGDRIAFSRESRSSHVFVAEGRARTVRPLTEGPDWDGNPVRSRDGDWVAFLRKPAGDAAGKPRICVISLTEGKVTALDLGGLVPQGSRLFASWSPDASELAFSALDASGNVDVYRIAREGGAPVRVTIDPGIDAQPAWSPDGSTIAYLRMVEGESQIHAIPATGGLPRAVTTEGGIYEGLVWSPDSDLIACYRVLGLNRFEMWTASARRPGETRRVLPEADSNWPQRWTPDGKEIIVVKLENKRYAFDAVSRDGSRRIRLGMEPANREDRPFLELTPEGQARFDGFYPHGLNVYSDGEVRSDIYILRVKDLLAGKVVS
jgi:Tol biopolymer transport system component